MIPPLQDFFMTFSGKEAGQHQRVERSHDKDQAGDPEQDAAGSQGRAPVLHTVKLGWPDIQVLKGVAKQSESHKHKRRAVRFERRKDAQPTYAHTEENVQGWSQAAGADHKRWYQ